MLTKKTNRGECEVSRFVCPCFPPGAPWSFISQHASQLERLSNPHQASIQGKQFLPFIQFPKRPLFPVQLLNPPGLSTGTHIPTPPPPSSDPKGRTEGMIYKELGLKARKATRKSRPPKIPRGQEPEQRIPPKEGPKTG